MGGQAENDAWTPENPAADLSTANELSGTVSGPVVQARSIQGDVRIQVDARPRTPVPAQLGPVPAVFINRRHELAMLDRLLDAARAAAAPAPALIVISGLGGVGKSSLALRWLHGIRERFADGQLYADLRGSAEGPPVGVGEVLQRFLRALGVAPERVPAELDEQVTLFRSATAGRRLAVMLDNALSAAQVRSVLPASADSLVCVTTRHRLSGLVVDGARFIELSPLTADAAIDLLARTLGGERVAAEPEAARELADLCAMLPIALCAAAARIAARPRRPIRRLVEELQDTRRRLDALSTHEDLSIQAVFDVSYGALPADQARLYRLLGLFPGRVFTPGAAGALAGLGPDRAGDLLGALAEANLIEEEGEDRYRFHDLLRLHAQDKALDVESAKERRAAIVRLAEWYLASAVAADVVVLPGRPHLGPRYTPAAREAGLAAFDGPAVALDWLEDELPNLRAVLTLTHREGLHDLTWQLCEALWGLFVFRKHYQDWLATHEIAVESARAAGNLAAAAKMLTALANAHLNLHRHRRAARLAAEAGELARAADYAIGEAAALEQFGVASLGLGEPAEAIEPFERARDIHRRLGRERDVALMTFRLGEAYRDLGRDEEAVSYLTRAEQLFHGLGDAYHEARCLVGLGRIHQRTGRLAEAIDCLEWARDTAGRIAARHLDATARLHLADALEAAGRRREAREQFAAALEVFTELAAPEADIARRRLGMPPTPPNANGMATSCSCGALDGENPRS